MAQRRTAGAGRTALGVAAGGGLLVGGMLGAALVTIFCGWGGGGAGGAIDLTTWLAVEVGAGLVASVGAGWLARRIAGSGRAPVTLALIVLGVGMVEAAGVLASIASGSASGPRWLVAAAPLVGAVGVLLGGLRGGWVNRARASVAARRGAIGRDLRLAALPAAVLIMAATVGVLAFERGSAGEGAGVVAAALTLDLTVVFPFAVFVSLVRTRRLPALVIAPSVILGYALASVLIPAEHDGALGLLKYLVIAVEAALLAWIAVFVRRTIGAGGGDLADRVRRGATGLMGRGVPAGVLTTEVSILGYAFGRRRAEAQAPGVFTMHRRAAYGPIAAGLAMALAVETGAVHMLVRLWSEWAAWGLTALSVYGLVWLIGDARALAARPTRIEGGMLRARLGLRWEVDVPLERVRSVELLGAGSGAPAKGAAVMALLGPPNVRLTLDGPVDVDGMYGLRRRSDELWLRVDEPGVFREAMEEAARR